MRAVLALALAAAGFGLLQANDGPELRAVRAPAAGIEAPDGALLAPASALVWASPRRMLAL